MNKNKQSQKIKLSQIKRYTNLLVFLVIIASIAYSALFIYKNFYLVITQSEEIIILQKKVLSKIINTNKFDSIIEKIDEKNNTKGTVKIINPFQ